MTKEPAAPVVGEDGSLTATAAEMAKGRAERTQPAAAPLAPDANPATSAVTARDVLVAVGIFLRAAVGVAVVLLLVAVFQFLMDRVACGSGGMQVSTARMQADLLEDALKAYWLDCEQYPGPAVGLNALVVNPGVKRWQGPYIVVGARPPAVPVDPWGRPYRYRVTGGRPVVDSAGPDGIFGTSDDV